MKCPRCRDITLTATTLDDLFPAQHCARCGGHWVLIEDYTSWREATPEYSFDANEQEEITPEDNPQALICPVTGGIMGKYRIAPGNRHRLDYSPHAGGVWLNRGEWAMLITEGVANNLNAIFTQQWQERLRQEEIRQSFEKLYRDRFGDADYEKAREIREWIDAHPLKDDLRAYVAADNPYTAT